MNKSRRQFFKQSLGLVTAVAVAPSFLQALLPSVARAQGSAMKFVVPGQGMAASLNYVENKAKVAKDLAIERTGVKFADQFCSNCLLFTKDASSSNGKCSLFPNEMVKAKSWCQSWVKKPS